jgi:hypothetical protein
MSTPSGSVPSQCPGENGGSWAARMLPNVPDGIV